MVEDIIGCKFERVTVPSAQRTWVRTRETLAARETA
jgi:hypothetical protein